MDEEDEIDDEMGVWEWQPLLDEIIDRIANEFDVQDPEEPERQVPDEVYELVFDAVGTWLDEQEARVQGLPPPVMTAREQGMFWHELIADELKKMPEGTVVGDVMPIVEEKMERKPQLRQELDPERAVRVAFWPIEAMP
jgi:hypothetical protein